MAAIMLSPFHQTVLALIGGMCLLGGATPAAAQPAPAPAPVTKQADTLRALLAGRAKAIDDIEQLQKKIKAESVAAAREAAQQQIEALEKRRQEIDRDLMTIASGIDSREFDNISTAPEKVSVQEEVGQLLTPLLSDLRELTRKPRAMEALQRDLEIQRTKRDRAAQAIKELERLLTDLKNSKQTTDASLRTYLTSALKQWQGTYEASSTRVQAVEHQLTELKRSGGDFWTELGRQLKNFVLTRGISIALAALAFFVVLFGLRALYFYLLKYLPVRKYEGLSFAARLLDVLHHGVSATLAILVALVVLYARGDWLLGGLAILGLGALLFVAKSGLFRHLEQVRTLLNLGAVREGERVLIDGVPWKVGTINLFTQLTNPVIGGTGLRVPLEELMKMTSRPCAKNEGWFPCRVDDWIMMAGNTLAQVSSLAPDHVELRIKDEQRRWMALSDFIKSDFTTLANGFTLATTFGIDYRHLAAATREIPQQMTRDIREALLQHLREEELRKVHVDFKEAAASSLDFLIIANFTGNVAGDYFPLLRLLQRYAVESCHKHGWSIPFPQLVVHQPDTAAAS